MNNNKALIIEKEKIQDIINFNKDIFKEIFFSFWKNFYPSVINI